LFGFEPPRVPFLPITQPNLGLATCRERLLQPLTSL
jgi:hypothetical protein